MGVENGTVGVLVRIVFDVEEDSMVIVVDDADALIAVAVVEKQK